MVNLAITDCGDEKFYRCRLRRRRLLRSHARRSHRMSQLLTKGMMEAVRILMAAIRCEKGDLEGNLVSHQEIAREPALNEFHTGGTWPIGSGEPKAPRRSNARSYEASAAPVARATSSSEIVRRVEVPVMEYDPGAALSRFSAPWGTATQVTWS